MWNYNYYVYIITNLTKTVFYIGVTNDLDRRLYEHKNKVIDGFSSKYHCHYLLHYEHFSNIDFAIAREKELKKWRRSKKVDLIKSSNPEMVFLDVKD